MRQQFLASSTLLMFLLANGRGPLLGLRLLTRARVHRQMKGVLDPPRMMHTGRFISRSFLRSKTTVPLQKICRAKVHSSGRNEADRNQASQYWGVAPKQSFQFDKNPWPWNSYQPGGGSYTNIDLKAHHEAESLVDKFAYAIVKLIRIPTDLFFQNRYGCRAVMLETVAAVPGMVAGMLLHLKSLRRMEHSGGWIKALLEEAENERMHLMTFMDVYQPKWHERALVVFVQFVFCNAYLVAYALYPRLAHRIVGYLEEEAIHSYTLFLEELDNGHIANTPAPAIAIDYWNLPKDAKLRDVVVVVRADEAHHRDVNHFAADVHKQGKDLKEAPVP